MAEEKTRISKGEQFIRNVCLILAGLAIVIALGAFITEQAINASAEADVQAKALVHSQHEREIVLKEADRLYRGYYYDEALALLKEKPELMTGAADDPLQNKIKTVENAKASLVKYEGPVEHVFFHSLIVYPQLAFDDKGHPAEGYNMWMTTAFEFKRMLPKLLERGYVLYPLSEYIEVDTGNQGGIKPKDIYLPPGKIPLVISVDDVNYYEYMKPDGFANRLVLGGDGRVWTEVITPEGETELTRDGDVMPILDDFVMKHPEFSFRGAKGTIALTGYEGALGYRITDNLPNEAADQQEVKRIADSLKKNGWIFACHSYTHNGYFRTGKVTLGQMKYDVDQWKQKIEPWVGETNIYISPFGYSLPNRDARYRYIIDSGFQIFCPVGNGRNLITYPDNIVMPRVNLDGFTMNKRPDEVQEHYFSVSDVYDPKRPPLAIQ